MQEIPHFSGGDPRVRDKLNQIVDAVNALMKMRGDEVFIDVDRRGHGLAIKLNIDQVAARMPKRPPTNGVFIITSNGPRGGMYNAGELVTNPINLNVTGTAPTDVEIGGAGTTNFYLLNSPEISKSPSELVQWDLAVNRKANGTFLMMASDDTPIYLISEYAWGNC